MVKEPCHKCGSRDIKCIGRCLGNFGKKEYKCFSCGAVWAGGKFNYGKEVSQ